MRLALIEPGLIVYPFKDVSVCMHAAPWLWLFVWSASFCHVFVFNLPVM